MLQSHLVELPINQLLERINTEMDDNPALEAEPQPDADAAIDGRATTGVTPTLPTTTTQRSTRERKGSRPSTRRWPG